VGGGAGRAGARRVSEPPPTKPLPHRRKRPTQITRR
jgi:hypothetical protein